MAETTENGENLKESDDPRYAGFTKSKRPMNIEDRMHGFLFFSDIVHDFKQFDPKNIDHLQRANVPLLERDQTINNAKSPVLIMTDYGSCNPHEAIQGAIRPEEEYFVQFWQHIDVFCYFTHGHIAIPPPTWINAAHRNGVQVIGTLIFEGDDPQTSAMLELNDSDQNWLADKLAHVAAICGFDGWLLNIESRVHSPENGKFNPWNGGEGMIKFVAKLRDGLVKHKVPNGGKVIWYDAVTTKNINSNKGKLDEENMPFAKAAGSVMVDYRTWTDANIKNQVKVAESPKYGLARDKVYFGVNLFQNMRKGGDMKPAANARAGSGLFATGWCFQKFSPSKVMNRLAHQVFRSDADKCLWTGSPSLAQLKAAGMLGEADDREGFNAASMDTFAEQLAAGDHITASAREYAAGSDKFFYTNYGTAMTYRKQTNDYWSHLNEQSVWPAVRSLPSGNYPVLLTTQLGGASGPCTVNVEVTGTPTEVKGSIFLHRVSLKRDKELALTIRCTRAQGLTGLKIWVCAWTDDTKPPAAQMAVTDTTQPVGLPLPIAKEPIIAIGLQVEGPPSLFVGKQSVHILDISEVLVKPKDGSYDATKLSNVELVRNTAEDVSWMRLKWSVPLKQQTNATNLPWSPLTGSFSHFDISLGGKRGGRSHTLAYVWDEKTAAGFGFTRGQNVEVKIDGTQFDGTKFEVFKGSLAWP